MPLHTTSGATADIIGVELHDLIRELYPIPRSLTGDGVRETLAVIARDLPLELVETASGTQVFDWTVPREWNVRDAWIEAPDGRRLARFADSSLNLLGYSVPVDVVLPRAELLEHVFTDPGNPERVPYRTSYWTERWGFCMSQREADSLPEGDYRAVVDATLEDGSLTYGEVRVKGSGSRTVLLTTTICHPALANDNLSGVVVTAALARALAGQHSLRHDYCFLWSPGTLGPLCWLHHNRGLVDDVAHGLAISCVGDRGGVTYKRSRRETTGTDLAAEVVLRERPDATVVDWSPYGGDERQFCAPGFDLPFGAFSRSPADAFPEYHSSADDLSVVTPESLADSYRTLLSMIDVFERDTTYVNASPYGEPQLGRRGLYRSIGGGSSEEGAYLWLLSLCDGSASLVDIALRSGLPFDQVADAADRLAEHELLVVQEDSTA
jgi:aminopeptidase-like protein